MLKDVVTIAKNCIISPKTPTYVLFNVTERCNSKCIHCNIWKKPKYKDKELTPAEISNIFSQPLFKNLNTIIFSGGEPFIRNDILDCILAVYVNHPNATFLISTNGTLTEKIIYTIDKLLSLGMKLQVGISVDGLKELHDNIRGAGTWDKVCKTLDKLIELRDEYPGRLKVVVCSVVMKDNINDVHLVEAWANCIGVGYTLQWMQHDIFHDNYKYDYDRSIEYEFVNSLDPVKYGMLKKLWLKWLEDPYLNYKCYALTSSIVIKPNGDVVPCFQHYEWKIGNLRDEPAEKIWDSWLRDRARETVKRCRGCVNPIGFFWSARSDGWPYVKFYLRNPVLLIKKLHMLINERW